MKKGRASEACCNDNFLHLSLSTCSLILPALQVRNILNSLNDHYTHIYANQLLRWQNNPSLFHVILLLFLFEVLFTGKTFFTCTLYLVSYDFEIYITH